MKYRVISMIRLVLVLFKEFGKARKIARRERRAVLLAEKAKMDYVEATRSVNTQIEISQDRVLSAIAALNAFHADGSTTPRPPVDGTSGCDLRTAIESCREEIRSQRKAIDELVAGQLRRMP